jgi:hypothetical protein
MHTLSLTLTDAEVRELTGYKVAMYQVRALRSMGIPFRVRPDGKPAVARDAAMQALGNLPHAVRKKPAPDFSSMDGAG